MLRDRERSSVCRASSYRRRTALRGDIAASTCGQCHAPRNDVGQAIDVRSAPVTARDLPLFALASSGLPTGCRSVDQQQQLSIDACVCPQPIINS
jgi:hypothetical protein